MPRITNRPYQQGKESSTSRPLIYPAVSENPPYPYSPRRSVLYLVLLFSFAGFSVRSESSTSPKITADNASLTKDALHALRIGTQWLESKQQPDGCWSNPGFPAMTGLVVSAILNSPDVIRSGKQPKSVARGLKFILSCVQPDGSIFQPVKEGNPGGLPTYNTAICLMALADANDTSYSEIIRRSRHWLAGSQHLDKDEFYGGMGYEPSKKTPYADLSNTLFALEAMRRTDPVEKAEIGSKKGQTDDLNWDAAIQFISHCQHLRQTNDRSWVSDLPEERGGFIYHPSRTNAGQVESSDGKTTTTYFHSYGSMTYAGLLSFIYAKVDPQDERVKAAREWIARHWTLDENPGMGAQGLYYSYQTMAKALAQFDSPKLTLANGNQVEWASALTEKLVSLQRIDAATGFGYWQNDNNRWQENDPVLVTAYTMRALELAVLGSGK